MRRVNADCVCFQLEDDGTEYAPPQAMQTGRGAGVKPESGFVVKGAPWNQHMPDTSNSEEFPSMGPASGGGDGTNGGASAAAWGRGQ